MPWNETAVTSLLGIRSPVIQAPMAGVSTPEMAIAVCERGGLGSLGGALMPVDKLREQIRSVRAGTDRPFNVNLFARLGDHGLDEEANEALRRMGEFLEPWRERLRMSEPSRPALQTPVEFHDSIQIVLEEKPPIFSFTFGIPPADVLEALRESSIKVLGTATTVDEARQLEAAGCDAVVAQGSEAGGHRGTFAGPFEEAMIGTMALVPQIVDAVSVPVIAAGGMMDGRGIASALALGAGAAQLGTVFLACEESDAPDAYKDSLEGVRETDTTVTAAFTGRPLRGIKTKLVDEIESSGLTIPPFPWQAATLRGLRDAALERGELDLVPRLAGQGLPMLRRGGAGEIFESLAEETEAALRSLA